MALYVSNPDIDDLIDQLVKMTGKTKVEVTKTALAGYLEKLQHEPSLFERIETIQERVRSAGFQPIPATELKTSMDEQWGSL